MVIGRGVIGIQLHGSLQQHDRLRWLFEPEPGLKELARVLAPGGKLLLLCTEDTWTGAMCSRMWDCRTYNRSDLRRVCEECGLRWARPLWLSRLHKALKLGGILVELHRDSVVPSAKQWP